MSDVGHEFEGRGPRCLRCGDSRWVHEQRGASSGVLAYVTEHPGLPLTTAEGISAERLAEIRYEAERLLRAKFRLVDQAEDAVGKSVLELLAECGRLREQLDAARQALAFEARAAALISYGESLPDGVTTEAFAEAANLRRKAAAARAALGVEGRPDSTEGDDDDG